SSKCAKAGATIRSATAKWAWSFRGNEASSTAGLVIGRPLRAGPVAGQDDAAERCVYIAPMQWIDEGVVLGVKRHGESSVILELMTRERGRHLGLVRGGTSSRMRGTLQPGNSLRATWRARLDDHLGNYAVEGIHLRAAGFLASAHAVHGVT